MKKAYAELIAGLIPRKMARNRWRGILRYGLIRTLRLRSLLKQYLEKPSVGLAVCVIAKDEGPYLKEWIDWHTALGVEKFYFYDNGSTDDTRAILAPYIDSGVVEYIFYPGQKRQIAAYDDCIDRHRLDTRWLAFIDIDEFIVPLQDPSIPRLLGRYEEAAAVEINWLIYGSNGLIEKDERPVMERFTSHALPDFRMNRMVKSIVNPRKVVNMIGCHEAARLNGCAVDSMGRTVRRHFREREPQLDIVRINHYAVKSRREFEEKQQRGRASGKQRPIPEAYFTTYDRNESSQREATETEE